MNRAFVLVQAKLLPWKLLHMLNCSIPSTSGKVGLSWQRREMPPPGGKEV